MDGPEIQAAFDEVFDQALVFHGFTDYLRDYDVFIYATADPRTGNAPEHLQHRFKHCLRALTTSALPPQNWRQSLDERLVDYEQGCDLDGYVWGVKWQALYPGMSLVEDSAEAQQWSHDLGLPFHEASIETNGHNISLVFADLVVNVAATGYAPFVVPAGGPDFKSPFRRSLSGRPREPTLICRDVAREGLTEHSACSPSRRLSQGGIRSCRSAACIGPAQALPSFVHAFPKLLRPVAACRAAPTRRSVTCHGFPWPLTLGPSGEKG